MLQLVSSNGLVFLLEKLLKTIIKVGTNDIVKARKSVLKELRMMMYMTEK